MERTKEQLGNHLQIFTDGSVLESGEVGCAFVIPDLKITRCYRLPTGTSIFTAERYATLMVCSTVNDLPSPLPRCESHGWLFLSGGQNHQPQLSRKELEALGRIWTVSTRYAFAVPKCQCGREISPQHALEG